VSKIGISRIEGLMKGGVSLHGQSPRLLNGCGIVDAPVLDAFSAALSSLFFHFVLFG